MSRNNTSVKIYRAIDQQRFFEIDLEKDVVIEQCRPHLCQYTYWGDGISMRKLIRSNRASTQAEFLQVRLQIAQFHRQLINAGLSSRRLVEAQAIANPQVA